MIYILKQTLYDKNRSAKTIDEFYYKGLEEKLKGKQGTGLRLVAKEFINQGKIIDRYLILDGTGDSLEITTIFKNKQYLQEFLWHPVIVEANEIFNEKQWIFTSVISPANDYLTLHNL